MNEFSFFSLRGAWRWGPVLALSLALLAVFGPDGAAAQVNVNVGSGAVLQGGAARIEVSGNVTNDGTFTPESSTVVLNGGGAQTVSGVAEFSGLAVEKPSTSTFTLGTAATVQQRLELVGGTFDNSAAQVSLADGVTIRRTAGTLSAAPTFGATVNVEYAGDGAVTTGNELPDPGVAEVTTLAVDGTAAVTLAKDVTVTQTLALRGGSLDNTGSTVTVATGATVEPTGGSLQQTPTYDGPVELVYEGASALTTGTELPSTVDRIVVRAPAGLTLDRNVIVTDGLSIEEGTLDLNGFLVSLDGTATLSEAPGAVVTGSSGQIQATRSLNAPSGVDVAGLGFTITSTADLGSTTVVRSHARPFADTRTAAARVYDVAPANDAGLNATIVVRYDESEFEVLQTESPLELYVSTDDGATWSPAGGTVDAAANTVTLSGVDSFSQWTVGALTSALPVELVDFDAKPSGTGAVLTWQTLSETGNAGFEVQHRGPRATAFRRVAFVGGAGTTDQPRTYAFPTEDLEPGSHTFRLRQVDVDGGSALSTEIPFEMSAPRVVALHPNAPNPVRSHTRISFTVAEDGPARVEVYNLLGQRIATLFDGPAHAGRLHEVPVDAGRWASGVYFYTLHANGTRKVQRMTVVR